MGDRHARQEVVEGIRFASQCEHHLLLFHGTVAVGYLVKDGRLAGLSKERAPARHRTGRRPDRRPAGLRESADDQPE
ncbi:GTP cyclohydrolase I [Nonomuraea sp. NPDC049141]|uniref:GTP cyclohydrolase I n=1 Tax=unclassified Nonomuraea TaxID=2593643 RepID=UPI00340CFB99